MPQLLDHPRTRRPFARADILSLLGETISLQDLEIFTAKRREQFQPAPVLQPARARDEEDPERWDGLS